MPPKTSPVFTYTDAIPYEEGVTRRDPSPVIRVGDRYYVWYSRTTEGFHGYTASVWYATSPDGHVWTEQGAALPKGKPGTWDEHAVFTPTILVADGKYYLVYTAVPSPFTNDDGGPNCTPTAIGMAVADSPDGPFQRIDANPILRPSTDPAEFDSLRVDDACMVELNGRYLLYYKGRQQQNTPRNTKMGVAIADRPEGPYVKADKRPLVDGGHEVCCWRHGQGVAALFCAVGPEGNTLQYSDDGIHFQRIAACQPPAAPGPYRADFETPNSGSGIAWGISMVASDWPYLVRFDCNLQA